MHLTLKKHDLNSETRDVFCNEEEISASNLRIMRLNFILLNIVGLLPPDCAGPWIRFIYKVFIAGVLLMEVLILLGQLIAVVTYWGNLHLIANTMCLMNGFTLSLVSCTYFIRNKSKILMLIDLLRMKFVAKAKSKYIPLIINAERQIKIYLYLSSPVVACSAFSWIIAPFINRKTLSNVQDKNFTEVGQNFKNMIFVMWTPFDIEQSPNFEIMTVFQVFFVNIGTGIIYAVGMMFLSLMSHSAAQFKLLVAMLNDMHENICGNELPSRSIVLLNCATEGRNFRNFMTEKRELANDTTNLSYWKNTHDQSKSSNSTTGEGGHLDEDEFQRYLVYCIKYHGAVINFVEHVNEVVSIVTFLQILNLPIMLCVTGFHMMQTLNNREQFFKFSSLLAATLYLIFSYSWFGQQVINESEEVRTALYGTDWYNQKPGFKRLLPLAIMRASKPVKVKAWVFYDLSFVTFASIINAAYTYFTMLIQLNDS